MQPASHLWSYSLVSVILMSLLSLIGLAFISVGEEKLKQIIFFMVSLAVGGLFGDAFIHAIGLGVGLMLLLDMLEEWVCCAKTR